MGGKLGQPILSSLWQDKAPTLCRWLSGWRKTGLAILSPPGKVKASAIPCHEYAYSLGFLEGGEKLGWPILSPPWQDIASTLLCRWLSGSRKTGQAHFSPAWQVKASTLSCHEYAHNHCFLGGGEKLDLPILSPPWKDKSISLVQMVIWVEKNWAGPFFPHPNKNRHTLIAFYTYSWQGMVGRVFPCPNYHMHNRFSPPH